MVGTLVLHGLEESRLRGKNRQAAKQRRNENQRAQRINLTSSIERSVHFQTQGGKNHVKRQQVFWTSYKSHTQQPPSEFPTCIYCSHHHISGLNHNVQGRSRRIRNQCDDILANMFAVFIACVNKLFKTLQYKAAHSSVQLQTKAALSPGSRMAARQEDSCHFSPWWESYRCTI